jgi:hypothetical protein
MRAYLAREETGSAEDKLRHGEEHVLVEEVVDAL